MKTAKKRKSLTAEQLQKRAKTAFKTKIRNIFVGAGFEYIPTNGHHMNIGLRTVEVDSLFIYENIWLLCEDTVRNPNSKDNIKDHIRTKNEAFGEIKNNLSSFISTLENLLPEKVNTFNRYDVDRIQIFCLYIPNLELSLTSEDRDLFRNLNFVQPQTLNYFQWMVKCIKLSARYEIFRFLNIKSEQLGLSSSSSEDKKITAPIIYPKAFTGTRSNVIKSKVRVVSFMMSAEDLLNTCFVLRKDNWEESIWLYQRLIDKNKIKKIRDFIETKGEAFYNNIIVALPDGVKIEDGAKQYKDIDEITDIEPNCKLILPKEMNSVCIIDGQHRIFAHYESGLNNKQEKEISVLRKQLHLLVTGLSFPSDMPQIERARIQSEIFLDINSNAKPVQPNVLLHIQKIKNPLSDVSLAQFVIENLNKQQPFLNMFEVSALDDSRIKTASIVKFALRYLVTLSPSPGKKSLYDYWTGDKDALEKMDDTAFNEYIEFCSSVLRTFFCSIKKNQRQYWDDPDSKLLSVISFNGFVIAFNRQLSINGVQNFDFYDEIFRNWSFDFSRENFQYTSSQYRKFSSEILKGAFGIDEETIETI